MRKCTLTDLDCKCCADGDKSGCSLFPCPYIMENLSDLLTDELFAAAVRGAGKCVSPHKGTLLHIQTLAEKFGCELFSGAAYPRSKTAQLPVDGNTPVRCSSCANRDSGVCFKSWVTDSGHAIR